MAHLITGYAGYEHIRSADEGAFNASFFGGGQYVMEFGNQFEGSIIDNNTVRILDGDGLMYGRHFRIEPNTYEDLTIATGTAGTNRIDLICMTYEKNTDDETEKVFLQVIKGEETVGTPSIPDYTDGNILDGVSFNQMPLYKVTIEGVVLSEIEPLFGTIPSYEGLAKMYADRFEAICEELKAQFDLANIIKKVDVVNNLSSTSTDLPLSAYQGKVLKTELDEISTNSVKKTDVVDNLLSTSTDLPLSAYQGKVLKTELDEQNTEIETLLTKATSLQTQITSNDTDITNIKKVTTFSSSVTFTETPANYDFYRINNEVTIVYQGESKKHAAGDVLFTIPSGYRPKKAAYVPFVLNASAVGVAVIGTDGICKVNLSGNATVTARVYFTVSYRCA